MKWILPAFLIITVSVQAAVKPEFVLAKKIELIKSSAEVKAALKGEKILEVNEAGGSTLVVTSKNCGVFVDVTDQRTKADPPGKNLFTLKLGKSSCQTKK